MARLILLIALQLIALTGILLPPVRKISCMASLAISTALMIMSYGNEPSERQGIPTRDTITVRVIKDDPSPERKTRRLNEPGLKKGNTRTNLSNNANDRKTVQFTFSQNDTALPHGTVTHVDVTCYRPNNSECEGNPLITADGSRIDTDKLNSGKLRWCAISTDLEYLLPKNGERKIYIEGLGYFAVHDRMPSKWKHKVDILVPNGQKNLISRKHVRAVIPN